MFAPSLAKIPILDLSTEIDLLWDELNAAIQTVLRNGQFIMGEEVRLLEQAVASFLGVRHAIAVNSGTDALVIGLRALGIGAGDEVLTTPFTFFATAESISQVGAHPVFVDISAQTFNLNPDLLERHLTTRTKAIMPVHLYGRACEMDKVQAFAEKYGLKVIEDCAQSFGAQYHGQMTGTLGHVGAFSFFPSKNLGAYGDGGLIATNDDELAAAAQMLRVHGAKKKYHNEVLGYNSRLDTLQAAILRVKLPYLKGWNEARFAAASYYNEHLAGHPQVVIPTLVEGHVFHQYTIRLLDINRDEVQQQLQAAGIGTMVYYPIPQDRLPIYAGQYPRNPVSDQMAKEVLSLPIWAQITQEAQDRVIQALYDLVKNP